MSPRRGLWNENITRRCALPTSACGPYALPMPPTVPTRAFGSLASMPDPASRTIVDVLLGAPAPSYALRDPGDGGAFRYGDLAVHSARLAERLHRRHALAPGDRVGVLLPPGPSFLLTLLALWRLRAAALVLTPLHPEAERSRLLRDAAARLVVDEAELRACDGLAGDGERDERPASDDLALLVYTSGTTSRPKGVMLRHRHVSAQCDAIAAAWALRADDVLVHALPLHHVHGLVISLLATLSVGGSARMLPRFDPDTLLAACADATLFMGVPTMVARILERLEAMPTTERAVAEGALRRLRLCVSGSAALPESLGRRWQRATGSYPLERFGMTELGVALSNRLSQRVPGSVGWPLTGVRTRVVGEDGAEADEGELQVAGPTVFDGYWQRPEADALAFVAAAGVRWFRTGDTVRREVDGRFTVLGRTSVDILKSAGYKLSALQIEEAIRCHPAVRDAAVVGLPDETYGQVVAAAVVLRPGAALDAEGLLTFLRGELAPYQLPRRVAFVAELPRNALGKVRKPELVEGWDER